MCFLKLPRSFSIFLTRPLWEHRQFYPNLIFLLVNTAFQLQVLRGMNVRPSFFHFVFLPFLRAFLDDRHYWRGRLVELLYNNEDLAHVRRLILFFLNIFCSPLLYKNENRVRACRVIPFFLCILHTLRRLEILVKVVSQMEFLVCL